MGAGSISRCTCCLLAHSSGFLRPQYSSVHVAPSAQTDPAIFFLLLSSQHAACPGRQPIPRGRAGLLDSWGLLFFLPSRQPHFQLTEGASTHGCGAADPWGKQCASPCRTRTAALGTSSIVTPGSRCCIRVWNKDAQPQNTAVVSHENRRGFLNPTHHSFLLAQLWNKHSRSTAPASELQRFLH